ncbi:MAG TPA: hypothetical protein VGB63_06125 [Pedobacter sp.]|jgi:hypothetical protein
MESLNRKKYGIVLVLLLTLTLNSFGQTWEEFFKQADTQKKYLLEQIAALKIYSGYIKQGYNIASSGLKTVKDITNGEFNLHSAFINSLKTVSPVIRNDKRVAEIISSQLAIRKAWKNPYASKVLSPAHEVYINDVKEKVLHECESDLEELLLVITSGTMEMKDSERIERLEKVHQSMAAKSLFTQSFISKVSLLVKDRERELQSVNQLRNYYGKD